MITVDGEQAEGDPAVYMSISIHNSDFDSKEYQLCFACSTESKMSTKWSEYVQLFVVKKKPLRFCQCYWVYAHLMPQVVVYVCHYTCPLLGEALATASWQRNIWTKDWTDWLSSGTSEQAENMTEGEGKNRER